MCIQGAAYETVPKRLPFDYQNLGEKKLKGFQEPVRAYSVMLKTGESVPVPEPACPQETLSLELPKKPSIAVLPFNNISKDSEQEFFADGISEDITTELSKFRSLFVIARNSSFAFKGKQIAIRDVGTKLGVRYIV